ncbi:hypothetical protein FOXB_01739 [Fusarium oxysporum f. sp. conglutinans Fo5176]|uniref:HNH nuclease domain-containing protein n=1 Tax=Fusarium oxysporum (strain Fo5176) TaxID=660025 RepID=F9F5R4_FUSOF|nr:hypothetical protein FOXB_01739 [Fusarium oxysporum f. sp. conglutinans Fo5176]
MDIDETTSFEVKSESTLELQVIEPPSSTESESEYTDELQAIEPPRIDKHKIDFAEQTKFLARNGNACVVTGAMNPNAYHIAPFTWNDTQEHIDRTFDLGPNQTFMVYSWWSKGYFAFRGLEVQSLGSNESNVILEFRWMPQTKLWFGQQIDIFNTGTRHDLEEWLDGIDQFHASGNPPPMASNELRLQATTSDGAPLCSGRLIHIRIGNEDVSRFKDMIGMQ